MANSASSKGNPASHRMSNPAHKARREQSWRRASTRHAQNQKLQDAREARNRQLRKEGKATPWQAAVARRLELRAAVRAAEAAALSVGGQS